MTSISSPKELTLAVYQPQTHQTGEDLQTRLRCEEVFLDTYKALHLGGKETAESKLIKKISTSAVTHSHLEMEERLSQYKKAADHLKGLTNAEFSALLESATPIRIGGWGDILSLTVEGVTVIVKKIRLTKEEKEHPKSTRNLFDLPLFYQYGVGSAGFGAYRELAAHEITTQWVLDGECQNFPLMYHARVLDRDISPKPSMTKADKEFLVNYWEKSEQVAARLAALDTAPTEVIVCMEKMSESLESALSYGKDADLAQVEKEVLLVTRFMQSKGFLHFDTHFGNLLTKGQHVYFSDFGLAISKDFELSAEEKAFIEKHRDYDRMYVASELGCAAIQRSVTPPSLESAAEQYFSKKPLKLVLPSLEGDMARRYRSLACAKESFFKGLREDSKTTPYPVDLIGKELKKL